MGGLKDEEIMASKVILLARNPQLRLLGQASLLRRNFCDAAKTPVAAAAPAAEAAAAEKSVFDNSKYQAPQYYSYNKMSFYDIDNAMAAKRMPQPNNGYERYTSP